MFSSPLLADASRLIETLRARRMMVAFAESCTGGLVAAAVTEVPGASDVVDRGFVTYSNEAKIGTLGVHADLVSRHGAVSAEVARAMAEGALVHSEADIAVSITGIAGPGGGSAEKPVGLVHFAVARLGTPTAHRERRFGAGLDRTAIRLKAVREAIDMLNDCLRAEAGPLIG